MPTFGRKKIEKIIIEHGKRGYDSPIQKDHSHGFFEIFYVKSGECSYLLKDTVYRLHAGDLVFISPGELHHAIYNEGDSVECAFIYFNREHIHIDELKEDASFMGSVPTVYREEFQKLLSQMLTEYSGIDEYSKGFISCYLSEALLLLMRHSVLNEEDPALINSADADILLSTKYIYKNFKKPLTLDEVASVASLSPTYFSKKFKATVGMGFKEYLNFVRLKHAQAALLTTDSSITDIALEYGFNDSNYFKDLFKKVYGKSPREFRKSNQ